MLVVLLRDVEADYAAASRKPLQFMRICQKMRDSGETTFRVQTPRTAIPGTEVFFFSADFEDADERAREQRDHHQVIDLLAPHVLVPGAHILGPSSAPPSALLLNMFNAENYCCSTCLMQKMPILCWHYSLK